MAEATESRSRAGSAPGSLNPFYDPSLSYQENYDRGPFGLFAGAPEGGVPQQPLKRVEFLEADLGLPFGIPAGPLLNANYVAAAFRWGYNLCHYKTVRTRAWPAHAYPNVMRVTAGDLHAAGRANNDLYATPFPPGGAVPPDEVAGLSITNSFGMPAQPPQVWQRDVALAAAAAGPGQLLVVSVVGTAEPGGSAEDFAADFAHAAGLAVAAGATVVEANLSCPNVGGHGLLCYAVDAAAEVCARIKVAIPDTPLLVKLGDYPASGAGEDALAALVDAVVPYVAGFAAINAPPYPVRTADGGQALPGEARLAAGICGAAIKGLGLDVVRRLAAIRSGRGYEYGIIGVGGVMTPQDYRDYRAAGADVVQGAAGPMWRPQLALEIGRDE